MAEIIHEIAPINEVGRPSMFVTYKGGPDYWCKAAHKLALLGCTDAESASILGITRVTYLNWREWYPEFDEAVGAAKESADANVAAALYRRAVGYEVQDVKIFQYQGCEVLVPYTRIVDPDVTAQQVWLRNRQRRAWNTADKHELSGPNGGPLNQAQTMDLSKLTEDELKQLEQLTLKALPNAAQSD